MKHEDESTSLYGNIAEEYIEQWNKITTEQANEAKYHQLENKANYEAFAAIKTKMAYNNMVTELLQKYNNEDLDTVDMANEDRQKYLCIPGHRQIMEDVRDQINNERIKFERRCRSNDVNKLRWYETALCSLMKNDMDESDRDWET